MSLQLSRPPQLNGTYLYLIFASSRVGLWWSACMTLVLLKAIAIASLVYGKAQSYSIVLANRSLAMYWQASTAMGMKDSLPPMAILNQL